MSIAFFFDLFLSFTLIFLAWKLLRVKDLFLSIVLFIVFGLLMALAWVRLQAPDIALVEAAVGAGLTGALFLGTLGRMESSEDEVYNAGNSEFFKKIDYPLLLITASFTAILCWSILKIPTESGLREKVLEKLDQSGVENPVTAVILNFRGYDTLLEIGVLLLVVISVASLLKTQEISFSRYYFSNNQNLTIFLQLMTPLLAMVAFYFLWAGSHAPGGAFQAGSILGGMGVLLLLGGITIPIHFEKAFWRYILALGFIGFLLTGLGVVSEERAFLEYPLQLSKYLILFIETVCTLSIAVIFISLFKFCSGISTRQIVTLQSRKDEEQS